MIKNEIININIMFKIYLNIIFPLMNENKINFLFPFSIPMFEIDECIKFI